MIHEKEKHTEGVERSHFYVWMCVFNEERKHWREIKTCFCPYRKYAPKASAVLIVFVYTLVGRFVFPMKTPHISYTWAQISVCKRKKLSRTSQWFLAGFVQSILDRGFQVVQKLAYNNSRLYCNYTVLTMWPFTCVPHSLRSQCMNRNVFPCLGLQREALCLLVHENEWEKTRGSVFLAAGDRDSSGMRGGPALTFVWTCEDGAEVGGA